MSKILKDGKFYTFSDYFDLNCSTKGDLDRGFTQLAIERIALDKVFDQTNALLYGIVTLGDVWQFGVLDRNFHLIKKDLNAYPLLSSLETLCSILIGILDPSGSALSSPG